MTNITNLVKKLSIVFFILITFQVSAQLSSKHYFPPVHSIIQSGSWVQEQYIHLSTPYTSPFDVTIAKGDGTVLTTITIMGGSSYSYHIGNGQPTDLFISDAELATVQNDNGFIIYADYDFYATVKLEGVNQGEIISSKGTEAEGTSFRLGSIPNSNSTPQYKSLSLIHI